MFAKYTQFSGGAPLEAKTFLFAARCPACRHNGTFEPVHDKVLDVAATVEVDGHHKETCRFGQRRCPNPRCNSHVFFVRNGGANVLPKLYPPETLDFDATDIPPTVANALEEAIACHSIRAFVASAIMVRKSVELLCIAQGITTGNLPTRIAALGQKITVSADLLAGIDNLRLLGNDAAHVSADAFNDVGEDEVFAAIELAKELLRATYQHKSIVERLAKLKK